MTHCSHALDLLLRLLETPATCNDPALAPEGNSTPPEQPFPSSSTPVITAVPVDDADNLSYYQFLERYMAPNVPVLIRGACKGWPAMHNWTTADGQININHLKQLAGHCKVTVTDTARHHHGHGPCLSMTFSEYCDWWQQHHERQRKQQQNNQQQQQQQQQQGDDEEKQPLLYLKDWHFVGVPEAEVYTTPAYFQEDWLNEYFDAKQQQRQQTSAVGTDCSGCSASAGSSSSSSVVTSDYRFVYCGPAGSWTPVHSDVLRSFSWSANVVGKKRWWLLPAQHTHMLLAKYGQTCTDFFAQPSNPEQQQQQQQWRQHLLEVEQGVGDVLFVPSGWHHMVLNEVDTISINHNWSNAHNIHWSWALLKHEHELATQQLEDCREIATADEFEVLVQKMLAANSGFDFKDFAEFLSVIISRRLTALHALQQRAAGSAVGEQRQPHHAAVQDLEPLAALQSQQVQPTGDSCSSGGSASNDQLRVQLLHCLLDIRRGTDALQQVHQVYVAAVQHNIVRVQQHHPDSRRWTGTGVFKQPGTRLLATQQQGDQLIPEQLQLPKWVQDAAILIKICNEAVDRAGL